jgi:alpha-L-arabinofuranosidase
MNPPDVNRRRFLQAAGWGCAAVATTGNHVRGHTARPSETKTLIVDTSPRFELSKYLYMQFMEPLGVTDTSVDAAWDFQAAKWREDVIDITQVLAPTSLRWGGCFCSYYRWKEGVGPQDQRQPMLNLLWGGLYNNQVGTHEFVDFCRRVGADPLLVVNFESDGRRRWAKLPNGDIRSGNSREAAEWVDYCNNPSNSLRMSHGHKQPYNVKLWQIGNETSYDHNGFDVETAAQKTLEFAEAMRKVDPNIALIGWGDSGWAPRMLEVAGHELQYLAFHHHFNAGGADSPLRGIKYREDPARTWAYLMRTGDRQQQRIDQMRQQIGNSEIPLALTECHYALPGRNRCEVLSTWAAGVAYARVLNVHERNGDILKFATLADFCGTRWQNNAIMIPVPRGRSYMMPVAMAMSLFRKNVGQQAVQVLTAPDDLDVTASRSGDRVFLHVVNTHRTQSRQATLALNDADIQEAHVRWFALHPETEIFEYRPEHTFPREEKLRAPFVWTFPAASVTAVELELA